MILNVSDRANTTKKEKNDHSATASIKKDSEILALPACCLMIELANTREMPVDNNNEIEKMERV